MRRVIQDYLLGYRNEYCVSLTAIVLIVLSGALPSCSCDDDSISDAATPEGGSPTCDGGDCTDSSGKPDKADGGMKTDDARIAIDADSDVRNDAPESCHSNEECDNGQFCDGIEYCLLDDDNDSGETGVCVYENRNPCVGQKYCDEEYDSCECDLDNDKILSFRCGGNDCDDDGDGCDDENYCPNSMCRDCDDRDKDRYENNTEVCDELGKDEDCSPTTYHNEGKIVDGELVGADGDDDGDGYIDVECFNIDADGERHGGNDCDDSRSNVNREVPEVCDNIDNNCNGLIDESVVKDEEFKEYGLRSTFCVDRDGDGWGNKEERFDSCFKPDGYVLYDRKAKNDCDDRDEERHPGRYEICDNKDNNCDGETDEEPLVDRLSFTDTDLECIDGEWNITRCPTDKLHCSGNHFLGCETFATTLSTCRACETDCLFSCGQEGCDEIDKFSIGGFHVCAVTTEGQAACWGRNADGQLGIDSSSGSGIPSRVFSITDVKEIATGSFHSCAIAGEDDILYCWGSNEYGQLGDDGAVASSSAPILTVGIGGGETMMANVRSIAAGSEHTCAVLYDGRVACWGNQGDGRLGNDEYDAVPVVKPYPVLDFFWLTVENGVQVVAGTSHSCLLTDDGTVMCWGDNTSGQLGVDGEVIDSALAQEVPGLADLLEMGDEFVSLSAGSYHTCALASSGKVYCWGNNEYLQLGRPADGNIAVPEQIEGLSDIVAIAAGNYYTCGLSASNDLMCWGRNVYGERGDDNTEPTHLPQLIEYEESFNRVAAGSYVTCARTESGQGVCWGNSLFQQLGNNQYPVDFQSVPQKIIALNGSVP